MGRTRRRPTERGIAAVELSIASLLLIPITSGVIDGGLILHNRRMNEDAVRAAARTAAQPCVGTVACTNGNPSTADSKAILALAANLNERGKDIEKVVVYRASSSTDQVPVDCLQTNTGILGKCNVYLNPVGPSGLTFSSSSNLWDQTSRNRSVTTADYIGVYASISQRNVIGLAFPWVKRLGARAVFRLEPPVLQTAKLPDLPSHPQSAFAWTWEDWSTSSGSSSNTPSPLQTSNGAL